MDVTLLYFDQCPNWKLADQNLRTALDHAGAPDVRLRYRRVQDLDEAERLVFTGSPTVLIDGVDPFAEPEATVGLSCRLYRSPIGTSGAPTVDQFRHALEVGG